MGLSGKVLYLRKKCYFNPTAGSVEAPLPSGYYSHHEGAGSTRWDSSTRQRATSCHDPTEGSLSRGRNQTRADSYTLCHNRGSLLPTFAGYATKEALISQGIASYRK